MIFISNNELFYDTHLSVMSDGCVAQFGSPYELLCDTEGGILTELVEETGPASRDRLFEMARMAYFARLNQESDNKGVM